MARPKPTAFEKTKTVAENRRARFEYFIDDVYEAGIALTGTEVKSLRFGEGSIAEALQVKDSGSGWSMQCARIQLRQPLQPCAQAPAQLLRMSARSPS
jgi:tmRNA-binding protein